MTPLPYWKMLYFKKKKKNLLFLAPQGLLQHRLHLSTATKVTVSAVSAGLIIQSSVWSQLKNPPCFQLSLSIFPQLTLVLLLLLPIKCLVHKMVKI